MVWLILNLAAPSGTTILLRLISVTTNDSNGQHVHISELGIMKTLYKTLQPNPILCQYQNQQPKNK
jgi:hypothetical protein